MKYISGDLVKIKLTSEIGMVVEVLSSDGSKNFKEGYAVRLTDYRVVKFYQLELADRDDGKTNES